MPKSQRIAAQQWVPSGNDYVVDGLWGRLGVQEKFGTTRISGSTNGLAVHVADAGGKVYLYAGASNGGVHLRVYDSLKDQWDHSWSWQSRPGLGYEGSQAIAVLAVSDDGQYLAAAQGNPSNYASVAPPSGGVQIGRINGDGSISWLPVDAAAAQELHGLNFRSLKWKGSKLIGTTWNYDQTAKEGVGAEILIQTSTDGIHSASVTDRRSNNLIIDHVADSTLTAGYDETDWLNRVELNGSSLVGDRFEVLLQDLQSESLQIGRVSLYPELVNGRLIAFLGSFKHSKDPSDRSDNIARIDRLEIVPGDGTLSDLRTYLVPTGVIGTAQGSNADSYYGNFSFQADPYDSEAMGVFSGGNQFGSSSISEAPTSNGGLVRVDFRGGDPQPDLLYGLRYTPAALDTPFNPGQPHADSRTIAFYPSSSGPVLLQTDDGGIWQLPLQLSEKGAGAANGGWWESLTSKGLPTLELNMVGWNSHTNAIASSYQDNAASLGYYGEDYATNFWVGDGQVALFDEAGRPKQVNGYLSSYWYIKYGSWQKMSYDKDGFIKHQKTSPFFLQDQHSARSYVPWRLTAEGLVDKDSKIPFILPVEVNPYRQDSIVMTGQFNVYETIEPVLDVKQQNGILFRSLLTTNVNGLHPTAIDNQGSSRQGVVESVYVGAQITRDEQLTSSEVVLYGRQSSNKASAYHLKRLEFSNLSADELNQAGQIQDIAHSAQKGRGDTLYWIQGGRNIAFGPRTGSNPTEQVLRVGTVGGSIMTYNLVEDLGIQLAEGDQYGQQALVYVPATRNHAAKLVIGGQQGIWLSNLDANGQPVGFTQMDWQGLPDQGPGSYVRSIQYDPKDDLLIAATQGQGSFLYSFSGDLGARPKPNSLLHLSNLDLHQSPNPMLDKRGNEVNSLITIALDSRFIDHEKPTNLRIKLHNAAAWRDAMEYVSLYNINLPYGSDDPLLSTKGGREMLKATDLLTKEGVSTIGGRLKNNTISAPLSMEPGSTIFNLVVNAKETDVQNRTKPLKYSVALADGSEKLSRRIKFIPYSQPVQQRLQGRSSIETIDQITGLEQGDISQFGPSFQAGPLTSGRLTVTSESQLDLVSGVYWIQNADGAVLGDDGRLLLPGDAGYEAAALSEANLIASFSVPPGADSRTEAVLPRDGAFLAPFVILNGTALFAFSTDVDDRISSFEKLSSGSIGFEDFSASGTVDFNDLILTFDSIPIG